MRINIKGNNVDKIIQKNPQTNEGLYLSSYKEGIGICLVRENEVDLLFNEQGHSFEFNDVQIDYKGLSHPGLLLKLPNMFFKELLDEKKYKNKHIEFLNNTIEQIDSLSNNYEFTITSVLCPQSYINLISKYLDIKFTEQFNSVYTIKYTSESMYQGVSILVLLGLFFSLKLDKQLSIDKAEYIKYSKLMSKIEFPYFLKYVYLTYIPKEYKDKCIEILSNEDINFTGYNTQENRTLEALSLITSYHKKNPTKTIKVLDFGCGEFHYGKALRKLSNQLNIDIEYLGYDEVNYINKAKKLNFNFTNNLLDLIDEDFTFIFVSEVIEHNTKEDIHDLLNYISVLDTKYIYITTPNKSFNVNYIFDSDNDLRHEDHKQEFCETQFKSLISTTFTKNTITFYSIGDSVKGIRPTSAALINL